MSASNGFICAHKLLSYLLLPFRLLIVFPFFIVALLLMYFSNIGILPKELAYYVLHGVVIVTTVIFGLNINVQQDKEFENYKMIPQNEKFLIAFNHINPLDIFVLGTSLEHYISFVAFDNLLGIFPLSFIAKFLDVIKVNRLKRTNTTQKIKNFLATSKHKLCIAPDRCEDFDEKEYIPEFKTGAFANKNKVLPIVIRYVPSYKSESFNWNTPDNTDKSIITHLKELLLDGNVDVYVKFLDLQEFNEEKHKDAKGYATDVREKMKAELKKMPRQKNSPLAETRETNLNCIFFMTFISLFTCVVSTMFGDYEMSFHNMGLAFTGFLYHSFPTNNTLLFDRLFVYYSVLKLVFKYTNTQSANLIKYCLLFYASMSCIRNNNDETNMGSAGGNKNPDYWLKNHLYNVQLPGCIVTLISTLDHNLLYK